MRPKVRSELRRRGEQNLGRVLSQRMTSAVFDLMVYTVYENGFLSIQGFIPPQRDAE